MVEKEELTKLVESTFRWEINSILDEDSPRVNEHNIGYFGLYAHIKVQGKECIILLELRERYPKVVTDWFDQIWYSGKDNAPTWDADYRWNHDYPLVVRNGEEYNLCKVHGKGVLMDKWVGKFCNYKPMRDETIGYYYEAEAEIAEKDYDKTIDYVTITIKGKVFQGDIYSVTEMALNDMEYAQSLSADQLLDGWINRGFPCGHIYGFEYKGASIRSIDKAEATRLVKSHHRFGGMFNSAEWINHNGIVTLVFRDYSDGDYD